MEKYKLFIRKYGPEHYIGENLEIETDDIHREIEEIFSKSNNIERIVIEDSSYYSNRATLEKNIKIETAFPVREQYGKKIKMKTVFPLEGRKYEIY